MEFWSLRNKDSFFQRHSNRFEGLSHFRFGKIYYKRDDSGEFVRSSTLGTDNDFWEVSFKEKDGKEQKECQFKLRVALSFLEANGFFKFRSPRTRRSGIRFSIDRQQHYPSHRNIRNPRFHLHLCRTELQGRRCPRLPCRKTRLTSRQRQT